MSGSVADNSCSQLGDSKPEGKLCHALPIKHDQLFLSQKKDIVTIPAKLENVVISHPWNKLSKTKEKNIGELPQKAQFCPKKIPTKNPELEVMAGSNGIPADAVGLPPVEKSPEEKCLGRISSDPGPQVVGTMGNPRFRRF